MKGTIAQIIGPVIDVRFSKDEMPSILDALTIDRGDKTLTLEVAQHILEMD